MRTAVLFVQLDEVKTVGDMPEIGLGKPVKVRASIVVPANRRTLILFYVLRRMLGERVGGWLSRRLPGPWVALILSTNELFTARKRSDCIAWEIRRLEQMMATN